VEKIAANYSDYIPDDYLDFSHRNEIEVIPKGKPNTQAIVEVIEEQDLLD